ncbi:MAG: branched-chain amino acid transport system ATP-binding protein [Solirubrobacteraceae bacterium]|nr:branched-chain amino acid transport system ATP-binding protein [Solirubrobacteraceae bacterium]
MALLELEGATKRYGALTVVDDLSLEVEAGEAVGVVGPNGAGKTTALSLIAGNVALTHGHVRFDGQDVTRRPAHARCRAGIGRTFQVPRPFLDMTVYENVLVGGLHGRGTRAGANEAAVEALENARLLDRANVPAAHLTLLERKRLEMARALVTRPKLVLLDESAGGLTEPEVAELLPTVRALKEAGTAVLWIEHVVHALLAVVDRIVAIDRGRKFAEGDPHEVMASDEVQQVYLGSMV